MGQFQPGTSLELTRQTEKRIKRLERRANPGGRITDVEEHLPFEGVVDPLWTYGKPNVTLTTGQSVSGVVSAFLPEHDVDIIPGATVVLNRVGDAWTIVAAKNSAPAFLRQIEVVQFAQNNWVNYSVTILNGEQSEYGHTRMTKSSTGLVKLVGLMQRTVSAPVANEVILVLPVGFRPTQKMLFGSQVSTGSGMVSVDTNGEVRAVAVPLVVGCYVSLANIQFNVSLTYTNMTLVSPWAALSPYTPGYAEDAYGVVSLRGSVQGGTPGNNAWTAPSGLELANNLGGVATTEMHMATGNHASGGFAYLNNTNAGLTRPRIVATNVLDGLFYPSTGHSLTYLDIPLLNSWAWYGGPFPTPGIARRPDGLVMMKGLIKTGASGSVVATLPPTWRPKYRLLFQTVSNEAAARLDIFPDGTVLLAAGSSTWLSLDGLMFAPEQ